MPRTVVERNKASWVVFAAQKGDLFQTVKTHTAMAKRIEAYYVVESSL